MENNQSKQIRNTRMFKAPVDLVWEVWAKSEHIANWWGPNGCTNTINKLSEQKHLQRNYTVKENCVRALQSAFHHHRSVRSKR